MGKSSKEASRDKKSHRHKHSHKHSRHKRHHHHRKHRRSGKGEEAIRHITFDGEALKNALASLDAETFPSQTDSELLGNQLLKQLEEQAVAETGDSDGSTSSDDGVASPPSQPSQSSPPSQPLPDSQLSSVDLSTSNNSAGVGNSENTDLNSAVDRAQGDSSKSGQLFHKKPNAVKTITISIQKKRLEEFQGPNERQISSRSSELASSTLSVTSSDSQVTYVNLKSEVHSTLSKVTQSTSEEAKSTQFDQSSRKESKSPSRPSSVQGHSRSPSQSATSPHHRLRRSLATSGKHASKQSRSRSPQTQSRKARSRSRSPSHSKSRKSTRKSRSRSRSPSHSKSRHSYPRVRSHSRSRRSHSRSRYMYHRHRQRSNSRSRRRSSSRDQHSRSYRRHRSRSRHRHSRSPQRRHRGRYSRSRSGSTRRLRRLSYSRSRSRSPPRENKKNAVSGSGVEKEVAVVGKIGVISHFTNMCRELQDKQAWEDQLPPKEREAAAAAGKEQEEAEYRAPFELNPSKYQPGLVLHNNSWKTAHQIAAENRVLVECKPLEEKFPFSAGIEHKRHTESRHPAHSSSSSVFERSYESDVSVSELVKKRAAASQRLQQNPADSQARHTLQCIERQTKVWAESKMKPGQFTGDQKITALSRDAHKVGIQAWAKKKMFHGLAPVMSGFGMKMLRKMGWEMGQPLGRTGQGHVEPITPDIKVDRSGLATVADKKPSKVVPALALKAKDTKTAHLVQDKHPVCVLQEICVKRRWGNPNYELVNCSGPAHNMGFIYRVSTPVGNFQPAVVSSSKKVAKSQAAIAALQGLGIVDKTIAYTAS